MKQSVISEVLEKKCTVNLMTDQTKKVPDPTLQLKSFKTQNRLKDHAHLVNELKAEYGSLRKAAFALNVPWKTFHGLCTPPLDHVKKRNMEMKEKKSVLDEFMSLNHVTKNLPCAQHAEKHFLVHTLSESYDLYKDWCKSKGIKEMPFSTFYRLKPKDVYLEIYLTRIVCVSIA